MPRVMDRAETNSISLGDCIEALSSSGFDPENEDSLDHAAGLLKRLTNNRDFLAELMTKALAGRGEEAGNANGYSPQAIMLSGWHETFFMRANIWPSPQDNCFTSSGAKSFVYGMPHDHNFSFLTAGYFGPGYESDYYEYDYASVDGYVGEEVALRFVERSALSEGKVQLYRAHKDVHSQLPAKSLSVSLNILHADAARPWFDQYGFDLERKVITSHLNPGATETFLRAAIALGHAEALDFADSCVREHPSERIRLASLQAMAMREKDLARRDEILRWGEASGNRLVTRESARLRRNLTTT